MIKKIISNFLLLLLLFPNWEMANAIERVVLNSVPLNRAYLLADKKSWMDYENFSVQIGEQGQGVLSGSLKKETLQNKGIQSDLISKSNTGFFEVHHLTEKRMGRVSVWELGFIDIEILNCQYSLNFS